jgi:hypothetical protein
MSNILKSNTGIAIIVKEWKHHLHWRGAKCPVHLILLDFVILQFIALYTTRSSLRWVCFAFVYKVGHNAHETGFSGTFAKVRKETISFVMFFCLSTWNNSAPTGRIFMKFVEYLSKTVKKIRGSLKPDKRKGHFCMNIHDNKSMNSSEYEKCFKQNLQRRSKTHQKHILCSKAPPPLKSCRLWDNVEKKYCTAGQATDDIQAHAQCMLDN